MNDRQFKKLLSACAIKQASLLEQIDYGPQEVEVSPGFRQRMDHTFNLLKEKKQRKQHACRIAASFLLILSVTFGSCMSINATRSNILHFFSRYFSFNSGKAEDWDVAHNDQIVGNVHDVFLPTWVPTGFQATESSQGNTECTITYKSGDKIIRFVQEKMPKSLFSDSDLEGLETITVDNQTFYLGQRSTTFKLLWKTKLNTFLVASNISKEEIIKFASGLVYKEG